jgi:hypothetical protein
MRRGLGIALAILFSVSRVAAQPGGQDVATAQALFEDGKRLMQQGKYEEACPKLVESQRLDPGGGTLLAIGLCHEGQGKTATAWADFNLALGQARKDGRADREQTATEHIKALEPKLVRVRITVAQKVDGLEVKRDGALVGEAQWGTPLPIDPGDHLFEATAPTKEKWSQTVPVRGEGQTVDVKVPPLTDAPLSSVIPPSTPQKKEETPPPKKKDGDDENDGSSQRLWGGVVGGIGLVGIVVGSVFGLSARSQWNEAVDLCKTNPCTNKDGIEKGKDAGGAADASTVFFVVGGVALAAGAVLWFTAPSGKSTSTARRLLVEGRF